MGVAPSKGTRKSEFYKKNQSNRQDFQSTSIPHWSTLASSIIPLSSSILILSDITNKSSNSHLNLTTTIGTGTTPKLHHPCESGGVEIQLKLIQFPNERIIPKNSNLLGLKLNPNSKSRRERHIPGGRWAGARRCGRPRRPSSRGRLRQPRPQRPAAPGKGPSPELPQKGQPNNSTRRRRRIRRRDLKRRL